MERGPLPALSSRGGEGVFFWGCGTQDGSFFAILGWYDSSFQDFGLSLGCLGYLVRSRTKDENEDEEEEEKEKEDEEEREPQVARSTATQAIRQIQEPQAHELWNQIKKGNQEKIAECRRDPAGEDSGCSHIPVGPAR